MPAAAHRAVVVHAPGAPDVLRVEERPRPEPRPGWVLVRVRAFGLNRAELVTRAGGSGDAVRFPRVLGIEAVGEVVDPGGGDLAPGQVVAAAMGGMGRDFDGGYEEYALLPAAHVIPVTTTLDWPRLGSLPESFGTAWGSLGVLGLPPGRTVLVRGGTSSVGRAAITLAKDAGLTVVATTRRQDRLGVLRAGGSDHAVLDDGRLVATVRDVVPDGVDGLLELVGPRALLGALQAVRPGGRVCLSGFLEGVWDAAQASAAAGQAGVRLGGFQSGTLTREAFGDALQRIADAVGEGRLHDIVDSTFALDDVADAHRHMEADAATGKVVGLV